MNRFGQGKIYLTVTVLTGVISCAFLAASIGTENWVTADIIYKIDAENSLKSTAKHGLFTGQYDRAFSGDSMIYPLTVTCMASEGVCMWSCLNDADSRFYELENLINTGDGYFHCELENATRINSQNKKDKIKISHYAYFQMRYWIVTICFLCAALFFNTLAAISGVLQLVYNPTHWFLSYAGIYVYQRLGGTAIVIAIGSWGAEYGTSAGTNVALVDTLVIPNKFEVDASLGFSFFFMLISFVANLTFIVVTLAGMGPDISELSGNSGKISEIPD